MRVFLPNLLAGGGGTPVALGGTMHAIVRHALAFPLCLACSGAAADDKKAEAALTLDSVSAGAGGAPDAHAAKPLTEEELQRLLDALEQEIHRK